MEVINIECPKCGATMSINRKNRKAECPYCKTVLPILDSLTTSSQERIRLKELELEHERREHNSHRLLIVLLLCIAAMIAIAMLVLSMRSSEVKRNTTAVIQTYVAEEDDTDVRNMNDGSEEQTFPITEEVYGEEQFEDALNRGETMEGTYVTFTVKEIRPQSTYGYNLWAGEHLNFVSSKNPNVNVGDMLTVKATSINSVVGSWIIQYEKAESATQGNSQ